MSLKSTELAKNILRLNVLQPLNVFDQITEMMAKVAGENNSGVQKLRNEKVWRPFVPPLMNYSVTALEVFLETCFLEAYRKPNGTLYQSKDELGDDIGNFCKRHKIPKMSKNISFQRMKEVESLYDAGLGIEIKKYSDYDLVLLQFTKRHLFTHRGGLIDEKFIDSYNSYHRSKGLDTLCIDKDCIGKMAVLNREWVRDSVKVIEGFIDFIASNPSLQRIAGGGLWP